MSTLKQRLDNKINSLIEGQPGEIGKLNADGSYTPRVEGTKNEVWVRLDGDPSRAVAAINNATSYKARLPVRVRVNASGRYEVIKVDPLPALAFLGEAAPSHNIPPLIGDAINVILNGEQFKPGRIRPENGLDLLIRMEELPYPEILLGGPDTIFDLTTVVATIGASKKAWVVISVDPTDNTITATKGADADPTDELTWADACAIAVPAGDIPLAAYMMSDGDTTLPNRPIEADQYFYVDLRPWLTLTGAGGGAPTTAKYWVSEADATLSAEVDLGALTTGLLKHTVAAGVSTPATATAGTDYTTPTGTENLSNKTVFSSVLADFWRQPCRVATTTNTDIASAPADVDSVTLATGDRILLTNQSTPSQNGLWVFAGTGNALTRPTDYPAASIVFGIPQIIIFIWAGNTYAHTIWRLSTTGSITIDTTATTWTREVWNVASGGTGFNAHTLGHLLVGTGVGLASFAPGTDYQLFGADSTTGDAVRYFDATLRQFSASSDKAIHTSNAETTLFSTGVGTLTLPANRLIAGTVIRLRCVGYGQRLSGTFIVRVKIGGATLIATNTVSTVWESNGLFWLDAEMACQTTGATGTLTAQGITAVSTDGVTMPHMRMVSTAAATIDTTGTLAVDATIQFSTSNANNRVTITSGLVEVIG